MYSEKMRGVTVCRPGLLTRICEYGEVVDEIGRCITMNHDR